MIDAHHRGDGGLFFLYGSGGTGKTYLLNTIISKFQLEKHIVLAVASSRIALYYYLVEKPHTQFSKYRYNVMRCQFISLISGLNVPSWSEK